MKAEIGFAYDDEGRVDETRLRLEILPQSRSEETTLRTMAKRMGWRYFIAGMTVIEEPRPEHLERGDSRAVGAPAVPAGIDPVDPAIVCRRCYGFGEHPLIGGVCTACRAVMPPWWRVLARRRWHQRRRILEELAHIEQRGSHA